MSESASTSHPSAKPSSNPTNDFILGLWEKNPVYVQALGMCPTLAVTNSAVNSLAMGVATTFVLIMSSAIISSLRFFIPRQVRIACYILVIATFVTIVDFSLQAIDLQLHKALGAFVSLIVVNCLILGRAESFASRNPIGRSILDAAGMGVGFTFALLCIGSLREILGSGSLFGYTLFADSFEKWVVMVLPSGGFFVLGFWVLIFTTLRNGNKKQGVANE